MCVLRREIFYYVPKKYDNIVKKLYKLLYKKNISKFNLQVIFSYFKYVYLNMFDEIL